MLAALPRFVLFRMDSPRHPRRHRLRRAAKWAGAGLCAASLCGWLSSFWFHLHVIVAVRDGDFWSVESLHGSLVASNIDCGGPVPNKARVGIPYFFARRLNYGMHYESPWWVGWSVLRGAMGPGSCLTTTHVPYWVAALIVFLPTACLFHLDRRRFAPGRCQRCGYDLSGLPPGAACPECGKGTP